MVQLSPEAVMIVRGWKALCRTMRPKERATFLRELAGEIEALEAGPVSLRDRGKSEAERIAAEWVREEFAELSK